MGKTRATRGFILAFLLIRPADWSSVHSATELFVSSADERIHTKIESAYNLRKYGDIFELLDQEARVTDIRKKEKSLDELRTKLDALMTKDDDVDIEKSILKTDRDCFRAGELYKKLNLFASVVLSLEAKGFRTRDFIRVARGKSTKGQLSFPECEQHVADDSVNFILHSEVRRGNGKYPLPRSRTWTRKCWQDCP
ncbi:hypothetical protein BV898_13505 [Hypsibius exemplaris]|uniref:Uncharacterized protein n=1 Tax=Hypsibius exemplaris TaxID=2072580 RepID=A0A1W0WAR2_HYPEX|nr:hypothetical protein BV898_13505 [Hypsibius exemplaris]